MAGKRKIKDDAPYKLREGKAWIISGDPERALQCFDEAIALASDQETEEEAHRQREEVLRKLGRNEEARASEDVLESLRPTITEASDEEEDGKSANGHMVMGALFFVGGLIATVVGYAAADPGGGYYFFWGAMLVGGIEFVYGLAHSGNG